MRRESLAEPPPSCLQAKLSNLPVFDPLKTFILAYRIEM
jgi:hypothetical protein